MSKASIHNIHKNLPHIVVEGVKSTHVIPKVMLEHMASGKLKASEIEELDDFLPTIIGEWLNECRTN